MRIGVVTPAMPSGERGGAEIFYEGLVNGLREAGHHAVQVEVPIDESSFEAVLESYLRCYELDVSEHDLVISTKAPTYMVQHPNHVSYLLHTVRVFYDMFDHEYGEGSEEQHSQRELIHRLDRLGLHPDRIRAHFANGHQTFHRLQTLDPFWRAIDFRALHHPSGIRRFAEPHPGEFVLLPGRLHRWKRPALVIEAFRHISGNIPLKVVGTGEDEAWLRQLAAGDSRIEFLGQVDDKELLELYSRAAMVPFVPLNEDYGLVTIEAFNSSKPVITCLDSGEPTQFVRDGDNGFVVEADPRDLAQRIEFLWQHPDLAEEMGRRGRESVTSITWPSVVGRLLSAVEQPSSQDSMLTSSDHDKVFRSLNDPAARDEPPYAVTVLDMQPIEPAVGGGRMRLLGLYHALATHMPTTYIGTYDWPGPKHRRLQLSPTLEEVSVPLSDEHFAAVAELSDALDGKTVIDVAFPQLAHKSPDFIETANDAASTAEIVVFSHPWVYPLVKGSLQRERQLVIYDSHNVEGLLRTALLDNPGVGAELAKNVAALEQELCREADMLLACSGDDRSLFSHLYDIPLSKIALVPNGTFTAKATLVDADGRRRARQRLGLSDDPIAIFIGSDYSPNREAAEFIAGRLADELPSVQFVICGGVGNAESVHKLGHTRSNVFLTSVIDDAEKQAYLAAADVAINPMSSGSGTNVKMFDFLAGGLPTISTPVGARGIESGAPAAFVTCALEAFGSEIRRLLSDAGAAASLAESGRQLVEASYSWERISPDLGRLLRHHRSHLGQKRPFFSVIVPSFERPQLLEELLMRLRSQSERDFEVIVVDQSKVEWQGAARFSDLDLLYIHTDVVGAIGARNKAAFFARGEVLAFTDDDCQPLPDWLHNAKPYFTDSTVAGLEGLITSDKLSNPDYREVTNDGFEGIGFMTANLMLRRELFIRAGGFDGRFDHPHFREDTDLAWRVLEFGNIPFARDVQVHHPPHKREIERESLKERNRFFEKDALLLQKHPQRYRELFEREQHYRHTNGFWQHFFRGADKYGVEIPSAYRELCPDSALTQTSKNEVDYVG